jgi:C4-dicarboxylate-specific signal transduction histidine kinase
VKSLNLKKANEKLKLENTELLKKIDLITSASKFGFFFEDIENNILQATEQLLLISNLPNLKDSKEADRIFAERIEKKYRKNVLTKIEQFYNGELENVSESFKFNRSPDEIIWLHLHIIAEKRDLVSNKPIKIIGYHQDITSQKEIEFKLNQSAKLESIGLMAGGIAHEINNPLFIISALNRRIKRNNEKTSDRDIIQEEISNDVKKIDLTIKRISKIIQGLKNISRDSSNDPYESIYIQNLFEDLITFTEYRLKLANINFSIEGNSKSLKIFCQPIAISQVLINLINNAIDAIENLEEKWIQLKIEKNENSIAIRIIDSGKGIDLNIQEKVMAPFFTTKEIGKGTGLGLSICGAIVKSHNGKFFLEKNSVNTTFIIELPINESINDLAQINKPM